MHFSIVPSGCTDVISSNSENAAQNENKEEKMDRTTPSDNKDEVGEKLEKSEKTDKQDKPNKLKNTTYIFTRYSKEPAVVIPSADHFTTAVRCCPVIFKLRPHDENCPPLIDLPYRMVYAIASKSSLYLYDTQQRLPFGSISNIHYSRLTDVTWSSDGKILIASSFDGFCTLISFEDGELGEVYDQPINITDSDDKENQTKNKKRNSNEGKSKTSPKEKAADAKDSPAPKSSSSSTASASSTLSISAKDISAQTTVKPIIEIPETIIATADTFESPEYKEKQATPIAIRRAPRTNPSTPSSTPTTPRQSENESSAKSAKQPKLIAVRRQPRNILPVVVEKTSNDQDEALDAWPIPIDTEKLAQEKVAPSNNDQPIIISNDTEDMHLVYEGDSDLTLIKTETIPEPKSTNTPANASKSEPSGNEPTGTPDAKNPKTPRRVQLRTISTPKSKKKLMN